jgi:hypothetical protein
MALRAHRRPPNPSTTFPNLAQQAKAKWQSIIQVDLPDYPASVDLTGNTQYNPDPVPGAAPYIEAVDDVREGRGEGRGGEGRGGEERGGEGRGEERRRGEGRGGEGRGNQRSHRCSLRLLCMLPQACSNGAGLQPLGQGQGTPGRHHQMHWVCRRPSPS